MNECIYRYINGFRLLSNVFDAATDEPLLNLESRKIVEINGIKVIFNNHIFKF